MGTKMRSVFDCSLYELNKSHDPEGNLTFIYENVHVPFPINRVFYSYDIQVVKIVVLMRIRNAISL